MGGQARHVLSLCDGAFVIAQAGLLDEQREQTGRRRRIYRLTEAGRAELERWRQDPEFAGFDLRDVGLVKLFFGADPRKLAADLLKTAGYDEAELDRAEPLLKASSADSPVVRQLAGPAAAPRAASDLSQHPGAVLSPMVGTAYLQASPEAPPFCQPGDKVKKGQTLLIVEAMKTMNPIQSPRDGVVKEVMVGDAQPVEFGQAADALRFRQAVGLDDLLHVPVAEATDCHQ